MVTEAFLFTLISIGIGAGVLYWFWKVLVK